MNNSRFVLALAAVLFASLAVVALSQPVVGGWQPVASEDETVQDLVQFIRSAHFKCDSDVVSRVNKTERQVVAGMNYKITIDFIWPQENRIERRQYFVFQNLDGLMFIKGYQVVDF